MKKGILVVSFGTSHLDTLEKTIAVIEKEIADLIELYLMNEGYEIHKCYDGASALRVVEEQKLDLAILDVMLPDGECFKDLHHIEKILSAAVDAGLDRKSYMVALGGGVIGDMTGFAASMWMRGIDFIQVPTTLLAQVDSSVGGKTGVNLPAGKNLIGAFHQPRSVIVDTTVLKTLPEREISAGIAEIIKYGMLGDAAFFAYLEENMARLRALNPDVVARVVARCCEMKKEVVREDEKESGIRAKLNLGHTLAHAIEKSSSKMNHGEAVAVGLSLISDAAARRGLLSAADKERICSLLQRTGFDLTPPVAMRVLLKAVSKDKKSEGDVLNVVFPTAIGACEVVPMPLEEFRAMFA